MHFYGARIRRTGQNCILENRVLRAPQPVSGAFWHDARRRRGTGLELATNCSSFNAFTGCVRAPPGTMRAEAVGLDLNGGQIYPPVKGIHRLRPGHPGTMHGDAVGLDVNGQHIVAHSNAFTGCVRPTLAQCTETPWDSS